MSTKASLSRGAQITAVRNKLDITRKEFADSLGLSKEDEKRLKLWETDEEEIPEDVYKKIMAYPTEPPFEDDEDGK